MIDRYFARCADRGVEADVAGKGVNLQSYFPYWLDMHISSGQGDEHVDMDADAPPRSVRFEAWHISCH
jgi:hypothetical protein